MQYIYLHGLCSGPGSFKGGFFRERFAEQGIELMTPDLNGSDFTRLTLSRQLAHVRTLVTQAGQPVTLIGSSMGAYVAALLAQTDHKIERLVLIAPAFRFLQRYLDLLGPEAVREWRSVGFLSVYHYQFEEQRPLHYGIVEDARSYESTTLDRIMPVQIFHGLHDETVPYGVSVDYLAHNPQADLILLATDHSMNAVIDGLWSYMTTWLSV